MDILLVLLFGLFVGIEYHGRGGSFFSFKNGSYPHLFGLDENNTPYFNYGGTQAARFFWWVIPVTLETAWLLSSQTDYLYGYSTLALTGIFSLYALLLFVCLLILNHGLYQDFGGSASNGDSTFLTFWLPQFTLAMPAWQRELIDFAGLTLVGAGRGLIQSLPLAIFFSGSFLWLTAFGALMGVAYAIGYKVLTNGFGFKWMYGETDMGEFFTGVFYGLGTALIALYM